MATPETPKKVREPMTPRVVVKRTMSMLDRLPSDDARKHTLTAINSLYAQESLPMPVAAPANGGTSHAPTGVASTATPAKARA